MEFYSKNYGQSSRFSRVQHSIGEFQTKKPKIVLKKYKVLTENKMKSSWTSKLLNWRSILEDQKVYRQMITKIELYNHKMIRKSKPNRISPC